MNSSTINSQFFLSGKAGLAPKREEITDFELKQSNILRTDKDLQIKEVFSVTNTEVVHKRGFSFSRLGVSGATYSAAASDYVIGVTSLALAPTIGLPRPRNAGVGKTYIIKDEAGGAATTTITVRSEGEETIDGASTSTLTTNYQAKSFYTDGANWFTY